MNTRAPGTTNEFGARLRLHALEHWRDIQCSLKSARQIVLFLDYDGTLSPIVADPAQAWPAPGARQQLERLLGIDGLQVAVITGRSVEDVRSRIGLDLIYAGHHGLEIEGPGIHFVEKSAVAFMPQLAQLCTELSRRVSRFPGAIVEAKGLTASVHFRRVPPANEADLLTTVNEVVKPFAAVLDVRRGKKIVELRPRVEWDKGSAARLILKSVAEGPMALPISFGDDQTDEDIFRAFPHGIAIHVGGSLNTAAKFFVSSIPEALELLGRIGGAWVGRFRAAPLASCQDQTRR